MKHFGCIILFINTLLLCNTTPSDVKHMVVDNNGLSIECFIDSIGYQYIYFLPKDSLDLDSMEIRDVYYVYSDFNRIFHHSWSFEENLRRIENRTGKAYTIDGDTLNFIDIKFDKDMIEPEILLTIGHERSEYISLFDIKHIETDFSIMTYSVKRGFQYSFYSFIIATTLNIGLSWDNERRAIPQIWDQYDNLLPMISLLGLNKQHGTGVTYESLTSLVPLTILISMAYDVFKDKNKFYFSTVYENKKFGRSMHVFSLKQLVRSKLDSIIFRLEKNKLGRKVIEWFR